MKIGIDIDDTICDTWQYLLPYMSKYYNLKEEDVRKTNKYYYEALNITFDEYMKFAKKNYASLVPNVKLKKDVIKVITNLKNKGYEIIFITSRSKNGYKNPYKISYEYLKKNKIPFDKLIVGAKDKKDSCESEQIDIFIDDNLNNCKSVSKLNIKVILFETTENKNNNNFIKVKNWKEIEQLILNNK